MRFGYGCILWIMEAIRPGSNKNMACQTKFTKFLVKISLTQFYSVEKGRQPWNWDVYISSTTNIVLNSDLLFPREIYFGACSPS